MTVVHNGDGRDAMARPVGPTKCSSSLALPVIVQPAAVHQMMVVQAQEREVLEVGPAARLPGHDVVRRW